MEQIKRTIADTVQQVVNGEQDALLIYKEIVDFEKFIKECKEQILDEVIAEAQKYKEKTFEHKGFRFQLNEGRRTYDFKHIPAWVEAYSKLKEIEERHKNASANEKIGMIVDDNGEIIQPAVVKYSKPSLTIKSK